MVDVSMSVFGELKHNMKLLHRRKWIGGIYLLLTVAEICLQLREMRHPTRLHALLGPTPESDQGMALVRRDTDGKCAYSKPCVPDARSAS